MMKKVFKINGINRFFWACNGQRIHRVWYVEHTVGSKLAWLYRFDLPRTRIEIVEPPPGRCPHCGEKT